jgi:hypothetical protein
MGFAMFVSPLHSPKSNVRFHDCPWLEGDIFAFKKIIQTCLSAQTPWTTLLETSVFKLVVYAGPIIDPDRPML